MRIPTLQTQFHGLVEVRVDVKQTDAWDLCLGTCLVESPSMKAEPLGRNPEFAHYAPDPPG